MVVHFIRKIWLGKADAQLHSQFIRFSKGLFENRAVISVSKSKPLKLTSTSELADDLVLFLAGIAEKFSVSGILLSRENPQELLSALGLKAEIKNKKKIFEAKIDAQVMAEQIKKIADIAYFMLFDMSSEGISLKIKKRLTKPGKSGKEKIDGKFCILELDEKFFPQLHEEFLFDMPLDFKKAKITHTYNITSIILPPGEKDFEQIRLKAKKKGKIVRMVEIAGKTIQQEKDFEA